MKFQLRTAGQIVFGAGELERAPELIAPLGRRVLLCTGAGSLARSGRLATLCTALSARGLEITHLTIPTEPDIALIDAAAERCRQADCQAVLAIGGGSVLDAGKAVAALATNPGPAIEYLEDVGLGSPRPIAQPPLPLCAAPTTAGSGSETTRNAVLRVPELGVKRSMRSDLMLPRIALIDPRLLSDAPLHVAAAAGLDALTHLIEGYVSRGAQPTTDVLAQRGIGLMYRALCRLADLCTGTDPAQVPLAAQPPSATGLDADRGASPPPPSAIAADLALGSLWGGIVLANAGLGAVHGLVAPLGGLCGVAHGDGCACLLPATFRANLRALSARATGSLALHRYREIAALLCEHSPTGDAPRTEEAADVLQRLRSRLRVPSLASQGVRPEHFDRIIGQARGGSMRSNPIELTDDELGEILRSSLSE